MRDLVSQVRESVRRRRLIPPGASVLVAVSGGVDSMVLLEILHLLAPARRWTLAIGHFNHRLRGRSSDADERLVRNTAKRLGWRCLTGHADVRGFADRQGVSVEMAARDLRHRFLARAARRCGANLIALAHSADDQVELFFLRLFRGAGGHGLGGMTWSGPSPARPGVRLVRPLLNVTKSDLESFARSQGVAFREDKTNRSPDILRNRIRHELLPLLVRRFQPALTKVIVRQMEILRDEADVLDASALAWLGGSRGTAFDAMPVALQRRLLQLQALKMGISVDFDLIEKLRQEEETPIVIGPGMALIRNRAGLARRQPVRPLSFASGRMLVKLRDGVRAGAFDGIVWQTRTTRFPGKVPPRRPGTEWFDADRVGTRVVFRHWQRGDRFQPSGMSRPIKLQDLFTNLKIPAAERRQRVVAATASGELWWVEGLRIGELFKMQPDTRRALKWQWRRLSEAGDTTASGG